MQSFASDLGIDRKAAIISGTSIGGALIGRPPATAGIAQNGFFNNNTNGVCFCVTSGSCTNSGSGLNDGAGTIDPRIVNVSEENLRELALNVSMQIMKINICYRSHLGP